MVYSGKKIDSSVFYVMNWIDMQWIESTINTWANLEIIRISWEDITNLPNSQIENE